MCSLKSESNDPRDTKDSYITERAARSKVLVFPKEVPATIYVSEDGSVLYFEERIDENNEPFLAFYRSERFGFHPVIDTIDWDLPKSTVEKADPEVEAKIIEAGLKVFDAVTELQKLLRANI